MYINPQIKDAPDGRSNEENTPMVLVEKEKK